MDAQVQFIQVTPEQLADLISENLNSRFNDLVQSKQSTILEPEEYFLTRQETANFFNISLYTVHDWMRKGIIRHYKAGNKTYFKKSELIEVLNSSNRH
jgi:excisionase family DNA binding protein